VPVSDRRILAPRAVQGQPFVLPNETNYVKLIEQVP
jgi:hypothetical protein